MEADANSKKRHEELRMRYYQSFDPYDYQSLMSDFSLIHRFFLQRLHAYFNTRNDLNEGSWILDVGCGPTAYAVLSASRRNPNIVLSDLLRKNLSEIDKWRNANPDAFDLSFLTEYVANMEEYDDPMKGGEEVADRTRSAIRHVIECDVTKPGVLTLPKVASSEREESILADLTYDVIVTSTCLEAATLDAATYVAALKNITALLKPGGVFIQCGLTGASDYTIGDETFQCLPLTENIARNSLQQIGMKIDTYEVFHNDIEEFEDKFDTAFVAVATKKMSN